MEWGDGEPASRTEKSLGLSSWLCHPLAVCPWANLCLSLSLTKEMGSCALVPGKGVSIKGSNLCKASGSQGLFVNRRFFTSCVSAAQEVLIVSLISPQPLSEAFRQHLALSQGDT